MWPILGVATGLGRWLPVGGAVLPECGDFQSRRQHSAITAHTALPVCEWPALGMPWDTARSNSACVVSSRCNGACTRGCSRARFWGVRFCRLVEISRGGGSTRQPQRTEPCQCVSGQPWACHGALQDQMQPVQYAAGVVDLHWAGRMVCGGCGFTSL